MRSMIRQVWAVAYFAVVLIPLGLALGSDRPAGANAAYEVSLASGLVALSLLTVTWVLPKRLRLLSSGLGIDVVMKVHRLVGVTTLGFVLTHVAAVVMAHPGNLHLLDVRVAPGRAKAAFVATVALLLLVLLAVLRRWLGPRYEAWRGVHVLLATTVMAGAALHVLLLGHLVDTPVFSKWFAFLAAVVVFVTLRRWVWRPMRALIHPYLVSEVRRESPTVSTVVLEAWGHRGLSRFQPGQFAYVRFGATPFGFEEHPFTIANPPRRRGELEFTVKDRGDYSSSVGELTVGDRVWVDGPHGAFTPVEHTDRGLVMVAAGVGITPMMSVLRQLASVGDEREHWLFVAAPTEQELLFREELAAMTRRIRLRVVEVVTRPQEGWRGPSGRIDVDLLDRYLPENHHDFDYYLCGPPRMVRDVTDALAELGVDSRQVHNEAFDAV
ncbi:ferredoxin reductase family protein [Oryzihumus sp.]|uniref:ferredoxin reductase family protein n=1 Tax=Oryzihumus sp. TaxID=1968903 RepID=UPI002ED90D31